MAGARAYLDCVHETEKWRPLLMAMALSHVVHDRRTAREAEELLVRAGGGSGLFIARRDPILGVG